MRSSAATMAASGQRVLVVDLDAQGNCATGLGIDKARVDLTTRDLLLNPERAAECRYATRIPTLHVIVGDRRLVAVEDAIVSDLGRESRLAEGIAPLLPHYDLVLIDTPPNLGVLAINACVQRTAFSCLSRPNTSPSRVLRCCFRRSNKSDVG